MKDNTQTEAYTSKEKPRLPIVFITGAGRRLGRAMALHFARKGWNVCVHYHTSHEGASQTVRQINSIGTATLGQRGLVIKADVRSKGQMEYAFDLAMREFGTPPDVLVNNAGVFPPPTSLQNISHEMWEETFSINVAGEFIVSQIFSSFAFENSRIINVSSIGGLEVWKHRIPYNVSKAAVIHLTKALARELAPRISVNCVCPGAIAVPDEPSDSDSAMIPTSRIPMQRHGTPDDVCSAIYFFATCPSYITGQILSVDGGYHDAR
ncbi:MAG: SDR family oxidoreductase [Bacteroidetes bacterium]|nr:SDR family oxidoreductase [Bacteroidota bacterium]